ncbi:MAG: hypothetical protein ACLQQ4_02550 [Bacteroidia bacterium]
MTFQVPQTASFSQTEYIEIGKAPVQGSLIRMDISVEIVENLTASTKSDSICIIWPGQNTKVTLMIDGNNVDSIYSTAKKMLDKTLTSPPNVLLMSYRCINGFEFKFLWDGTSVMSTK